MKYNISAVSYTNTKPLLHLIQHTQAYSYMNLQYDIPADCATKLIDGKVDIGLVPVAVFPLVKGAHIISDYCISSTGAVNSVFILSHKPIMQVNTLKLDAHSRTSNMLAQVLVKFYWQRSVEVLPADSDKQADAEVLIGDRTFGITGWPYMYDMGQEWFNFTKLPFLFAAWIANCPVDEHFKILFNQAQQHSLNNVDELINTLTVPAGFNLKNYFYHNIEYRLNDDKIKAMHLFHNYISKLGL